MPNQQNDPTEITGAPDRAADQPPLVTHTFSVFDGMTPNAAWGYVQAAQAAGATTVPEFQEAADAGQTHVWVQMAVADDGTVRACNIVGGDDLRTDRKWTPADDA
jgi:glycine/D-amino acid oxidase-like deaminating enzyme